MWSVHRGNPWPFDVTADDHFPQQGRSLTSSPDGCQAVLNGRSRIGDERRKALSNPAFDIPMDHFFDIICRQCFTSAEPDALEAVHLNVAQTRSSQWQSQSIHPVEGQSAQPTRAGCHATSSLPAAAYRSDSPVITVIGANLKQTGCGTGPGLNHNLPKPFHNHKSCNRGSGPTGRRYVSLGQRSRHWNT